MAACAAVPEYGADERRLYVTSLSRHFHETYAIEIVEKEVDEFHCGDSLHRAGRAFCSLIRDHANQRFKLAPTHSIKRTKDYLLNKKIQEGTRHV